MDFHLVAPHRRPALGRPPWRKLLRLALYAVGGAALGYLLIANTLLRTRVLRNTISGSSSPFALSGNSSALLFDYRSAYSLLPGRVHLEGVTLRGRDQAVEWRLTVGSVDVVISLPDLLHRTFRATRLRASELSMWARLRLSRAAATPSVVAALPPIPGFADPPLADDGPRSPPLSDADYKLWTLDLRDVEVEHLRELWIHTLRSDGDSHVRGRWLFRPQRWLDVGPALVDTSRVDLFFGKEPLARGLEGSFSARVDPFDVRRVDGLAIFDHVSYDGRLRGHAVVAGALRVLAPGSGVDFTHWETPADARIVLSHGKLGDGTRVRTEAAGVAVETRGLAFDARIQSDFGVDGGFATLHSRSADLHVARAGTEQARVTRIDVVVTSHELEVAQGFGDAHFALDVTGAETSDVGKWTRLLPPGSTFSVRSGTVTAAGHAEGSLAERRGRGELQLSARRLSVERGRDHFTADLTGHARLVDASLAGGWGIGTATVAADAVAAQVGSAVLTGKLAVGVELRRGTWASRTFDFSGSNASLQGVAVGSELHDAPILLVSSVSAVAPHFTLAPSGMNGQLALDLRGAKLEDLARVRELLAFPRGVSIEHGSASARLHTDVDLDSGSMRGDGDLAVRGLVARVGSSTFFGDLAGRLNARRSAREQGATDFSGSTLAITHASTGNAVPPEDAWWGKIALRDATLRTGGDAHLDVKAHVSAKDATPATALVAQNTGVPSWAANIFRMPVLDADGQVRLSRSSLELRSLFARGGGTSLRAEYAERDHRRDGGVLMDLGWIELGYDLADGATGLVLLGPESWFQRRVATMRDAAAAAERARDAAERLDRYAALTPERRRAEATELAGQCSADARTCDHGAAETLLRSAADPGEREKLSGVLYAPVLVAAAKRGTDGATLDPLVVGSSAEALATGGEATLDNIASVPFAAAATDPDAARGKVTTVSGHASSIERDGSYSSGTLTTSTTAVYFVTPFAVPAALEKRFRGVFLERYTPGGSEQSHAGALVLVGAFVP